MDNENCKRHGHCMCTELTIGFKPHTQCCNCGYKKVKEAEPKHVCVPCTLNHYPTYQPYIFNLCNSCYCSPCKCLMRGNGITINDTGTTPAANGVSGVKTLY